MFEIDRQNSFVGLLGGAALTLTMMFGLASEAEAATTSYESGDCTVTLTTNDANPTHTVTNAPRAKKVYRAHARKKHTSAPSRNHSAKPEVKKVAPKRVASSPSFTPNGLVAPTISIVCKTPMPSIPSIEIPFVPHSPEATPDPNAHKPYSIIPTPYSPRIIPGIIAPPVGGGDASTVKPVPKPSATCDTFWAIVKGDDGKIDPTKLQNQKELNPKFYELCYQAPENQVDDKNPPQSPQPEPPQGGNGQDKPHKVPEPSSLIALFALAVAGFFSLRRKKEVVATASTHPSIG